MAMKPRPPRPQRADYPMAEVLRNAEDKKGVEVLLAGGHILTGTIEAISEDEGVFTVRTQEQVCDVALSHVVAVRYPRP